MAPRPDPKELAQLADALAWKLADGDVAGANNLAKLEQWVTRDDDTPTEPDAER